MSLLTGTRGPVESTQVDPAASRRYKVLITPEWYPWPEEPNFGIFCREQALVASSRHDVVVLAWRPDYALHKPFSISEVDEDGLRTFRVRFRGTRSTTLRSIYRLAGVFSVVMRLRGRNRWVPDIVHAHEYDAGKLAHRIARLAGASVVISEHASDVARGRLSVGEAKGAADAFRRASIVSPVSEDLGRRITSLVGPTPIIPVPNSVDSSLFSAAQRAASGRIRLLSVGNLVEVKGHRYLIDAFKLLRDAAVDATLDVVGDGPLRGQLEERAESLEIGDLVTFHGRVPKQRVAELMHQADIFVLPSIWETNSCVLLEAMSAGLPSVATNVGGIPEIIDRTVGALAEPDSPAALAAAVEQVIRSLEEYDPSVLHELAARRYGREAIASRWTAVYELARERQRARWRQ